MHNWYNTNFDVLLVQYFERIFQIKFWFITAVNVIDEV